MQTLIANLKKLFAKPEGYTPAEIVMMHHHKPLSDWWELDRETAERASNKAIKNWHELMELECGNIPFKRFDTNELLDQWTKRQLTKETTQ